MINQKEEYLWVDQYKPNKLSDIILPDKYMEKFSSYIKDNQIPHLLFQSKSPGTGKTSLAKLLVNELQAEHIFINSSDDSGISTLRNKIKDFISSAPLMMEYKCPHKIIILDEFDGSSQNLQSALKNFLESYSSEARFIVTCNQISKIIDPLQSRLATFDFSFTETSLKEEMIIKTCKHIKSILEEKNITFTQDNLVEIVLKNFPDIRSAIKTIQLYTDSNNGVLDGDVMNFNMAGEDFIELLINKKFTEARKYIVERNIEISSVYRTLYDMFLDKIPKKNYAQGLVLIAEYMHRHPTSIDGEVNLASCLIELISLV